MIVYDLDCSAAHRFEAWFADSEAFVDQQQRGLVSCPYCGSTEVTRGLSVPRIGTGASAQPSEQMHIAQLAALQAAMLKKSTWVGSDFAKQARSMAEGSAEPSTIHGQATVAEARELREDGIGVVPLPFPVVPPEAQN